MGNKLKILSDAASKLTNIPAHKRTEAVRMLDALMEVRIRKLDLPKTIVLEAITGAHITDIKKNIAYAQRKNTPARRSFNQYISKTKIKRIIKPQKVVFIHHSRYGTVSINIKNYGIYWKKLLISAGSIPVAYFSETLTAMTILGVLASGAVRIFDEIDAKILGIIHLNKRILPLMTEEFFRRTSPQFPPEISESLYMERIVRLSGHGAISIDNDVIKITEDFVNIG